MVDAVILFNIMKLPLANVGSILRHNHVRRSDIALTSDHVTELNRLTKLEGFL